MATTQSRLDVMMQTGSHAVRVVHVESRPSDDTRSICNTKDLWDPSNVVAPMGLDGRANGQSDAARQRRHEAPPPYVALVGANRPLVTALACG